MRRSVSYLLLLLATLGSVAQTNQMLRTQAYHAMKDKDWYGATQYYNRLYYRDSSNLRTQYQYAEAARLAYDPDVAYRLYKKVAYQDNGKKYPMVYYWMGHLLKTQENYKEAKKNFTKFYKLKVSKRKMEELSYYRMRAKMEAEACDLAQIMIANPVSTSPDHLEATINTKMSEYAAFEKDSTLYFSSLRFLDRRPSKDDEDEGPPPKDYSKIYRSETKKQKWTKVKAMDTTFNSKVFHSANTCFSDDGKLMIFSRCTSTNSADYACDLYQSKQLKTRWLTPVKMEEPVNQPSVSTTQPNFGVMNGKTVLFFVSDRPGGEGGLDIWYSFMDETGNYSEPVNAGKNVNTPEDDVTPWFVSDQQILFFSSTYHKGLGGFDIFKSQLKDGQFGEPQNAGYPINTSHNDTYYSVNTRGTKVYLTSNRKGSFFENKINCCSDIYAFKIDTFKPPAVVPPDTNLIVRQQLKLLVPLTLYFHNDQPDPATTNTVTAVNYETTYNDYKLLEQKYVTEYAKGLKGDVKEIATNNISNFFTDSLDAGMDGLRRFSDLLEKVLLAGETVTITMKGYCSPLASTNYNINLAKRRISSLRNYLLTTKNGLFVKYVNNPNSGEGKITFEDVDIGELPVSKASDNLQDKRNSVYSPFAASERKIQIIAISYGAQDKK